LKLKDLLSPFILIPAGILFLIISFLVYTSNGKNAKLIAAKLKLGAFLLTFSWFVTNCDGPITCYAPFEPNDGINFYSKDTTDFSTFKAGDTIFGNVSQRTYSNYSFKLIDSVSKVNVLKGSLTAKDGSFDNSSEQFYFLLDSNLKKGAYFINFYGEKTAQVQQLNILDSGRIIHVK
jgi:hypothetical protein